MVFLKLTLRPYAVRQLAVVQKLQEQAENFRMRFFNFIKQHHAVWTLQHRVRQSASPSP